jgi:hypothetical protein
MNRSVEYWCVVSNGDVEGDIYKGAYPITQHPNYGNHRLVKAGTIPSAWNNVKWRAPLEEFRNVRLTMPASSSTVPPDVSDWSPWVPVQARGSELVVVWEFETEIAGSTDNIDIVFEAEWRTPSSTSFTTQKAIFTYATDVGTGVGPRGMVDQAFISIPSQAQFFEIEEVRIRLVRNFGGGVARSAPAFTVRFDHVSLEHESQPTWPRNETLLYARFVSINGGRFEPSDLEDQLQDFLNEPLYLRFAGRRVDDLNSNGRLASTSYLNGSPTHAIAHTLREAGSIVDIDYSGLDAAKSALRNLPAGIQEADRFCHVFRERMSVAEQVQMICDHARIIPSALGNRTRFIYDGPRFPTSLFNGLNKVSPEELEVGPSDETPIAGTAVRYYDRRSKAERRVVWPPTASVNLDELDFPGIGFRSAALRRAKFEWQKYLLRRSELRVEVHEEGRRLRPGDVVVVSDGIKDFTGEDEGQGRIESGEIVVTDPDFDPSGAVGETVYLRHPDGSEVWSGAVTGVSGAGALQVASAPSWPALLATRRRDLPFVVTSSVGALLWVVAGVDDRQDGTVSLELYPYDVGVYTADFEPIPNDPWDDRSTPGGSSAPD